MGNDEGPGVANVPKLASASSHHFLIFPAPLLSDARLIVRTCRERFSPPPQRIATPVWRAAINRRRGSALSALSVQRITEETAMNAPATQVIGTRHDMGTNSSSLTSPDGENTRGSNMLAPTLYVHRACAALGEQPRLSRSGRHGSRHLHTRAGRRGEPPARAVARRLFPRLELVDIHVAAAIVFILNPLLSFVLWQPPRAARERAGHPAFRRR